RGAQGRRRRGGRSEVEGTDLSLSSLSFSFSGSDPAGLGHKKRRRRRSWVFRVLRLLRFLWPRLVGAGLGRRILTQRREDAEGPQDGGAEVGGTNHSLSSLSFSFSGSARLGRGGGGEGGKRMRKGER